MSFVLECRGVRRRAGQREILKGIDLSIPEGQVCALFGPNGAGKSTLMKIMALLMRPTFGMVFWEGRPVAGREAIVRQALGVVSHATYLYNSLTAEENLWFHGRLFGVPNLRQRVEEVLEAVGLYYARHDPVGTFSRGMQQRLTIGRAILHRPRVLLLDEPYTGLDQEGQALLSGIIRDFRGEGGACLIISHDLQETLSLSDRFVIMKQGEIVREGACSGLSPEDFASIYQEAVGDRPESPYEGWHEDWLPQTGGRD